MILKDVKIEYKEDACYIKYYDPRVSAARETRDLQRFLDLTDMDPRITHAIAQFNPRVDITFYQDRGGKLSECYSLHIKDTEDLPKAIASRVLTNPSIILSEECAKALDEAAKNHRTKMLNSVYRLDRSCCRAIGNAIKNADAVDEIGQLIPKQMAEMVKKYGLPWRNIKIKAKDECIRL